MTAIMPQHQSFRSRFGLGTKNVPHSGKLVKRSHRLDGSDGEEDRQKSISSCEAAPIDLNREPSRHKSIFSIRSAPTKPTSPISNDPAKFKSHRKLTKHHRQQPVQLVLDKDTGERKDLTDMLHAFTYSEQTDDIEETSEIVSLQYDQSRPDGGPILARMFTDIWGLIGVYLTPVDIANLSITCRSMYRRLGTWPCHLLQDPANRHYRLAFLLAMDQNLPGHLFCFPCSQWHLRITPGSETLKPAAVLNPFFRCPNSTNNLLPPPRLRISEGRILPFALVQLSKRHWAYGSAHGIPARSLARRWKDDYSSWAHESLYHINDNGHVLMRIKSQVFVHPGMTISEKRLLLFSRNDYTPYFSVCTHWRCGILMSIPKCALDHIPIRKINAFTQLRMQRAAGPVVLCDQCKPIRRCPKCPTEYLVELKLVEDKSEKSHGPERFKQALVVTRWSDLGQARSPEDPEWSSIVGKFEGYDSVTEVGRRAVSGVFESAFTDTIPGQRILSMNPDGAEEDEDGNNWY